MHPDLDLHGVLRAAYQQDLRAEAAKARLLAAAGKETSNKARREEKLLPLAKALLMLVRRQQLEFGEVSQ